MADDYGSLQARIADELVRSDLTSQIRLAILTAIQEASRERWWFLEGQQTTTTVANQPNYGLPSNLVFPDTVTIAQNGTEYVIDPWSWQQYQEAILSPTASVGFPGYWVIYDEQLWLYPTPTAAHTVTMSNVGRLTALSAPTDTNAWMTHGEPLCRAMAKRELALHVIQSPELAQTMNAAVEMARAGLRRENTRKLTTGRIRATSF